jgi:hypothetical protein
MDLPRFRRIWLEHIYEHFVRRGYFAHISYKSVIPIVAVRERVKLEVVMVHASLTGYLRDPVYESLNTLRRMAPSAEILVAVPRVKRDDAKRRIILDPEGTIFYRFEPPRREYGEIHRLREMGYKSPFSGS